MWLNTLREMRKMCGKTSQQISEEINEPKSTIDKLFSGNTKEPRLTLVMKVVHCMGFSLDDLTNEKTNTMLLNEHERKLVIAYRQQPSMQDAVDKLLGVEPENIEVKKQA